MFGDIMKKRVVLEPWTEGGITDVMDRAEKCKSFNEFYLFMQAYQLKYPDLDVVNNIKFGMSYQQRKNKKIIEWIDDITVNARRY